MERLVPDVVEPLRLRHARPDAGIDEVEEEQAANPLRAFSRQRLHRGAADIMADHTHLLEAERVHQRQHVLGMAVGAEWAIGFVAVAETAQIRRQQRVAIGKPRHHGFPGQPEFGPAMQQQERGPFAGPRDMKGGLVGGYRQMLHRVAPFFPAGPLRNSARPRLVSSAILA